MKTCLVTGGAGFIGCALSHMLISMYDCVVCLDNLHPQIHSLSERPNSLDKEVYFVKGDICCAEQWDSLLSVYHFDTIIHLAAETGTGQSLRASNRHALVNVAGTTQMLDALVRHKALPSQILLASSRAVYGEGAWERDSKLFYPLQRTKAQLEKGEWDFPNAVYLPFCADVNQEHPVSIYGATKLAQEYILSSWAVSFEVKLKILRLQNVYGPGQSLINSYTGIVSLFARMAKSGESIPLYEDGAMLRDFVYIEDVTAAIVAALKSENIPICDIGLGQKTTIAKVAEIITKHYGAPPPHICGKYRFGDVRHASCNLDSTFHSLDWRPQWPLEDGLTALCNWIDNNL